MKQNTDDQLCVFRLSWLLVIELTEIEKMKNKTKKQRSNQKSKRRSAGTNKGTSGMQRDFYANLFQRVNSY